MKVLKCKKCGKHNKIYTIEIITERFPMYVTDEGSIEFSEFSGKTLMSVIDSIICGNCEEDYGSNLENIEELIVEYTGEEE